MSEIHQCVRSNYCVLHKLHFEYSPIPIWGTTTCKYVYKHINLTKNIHTIICSTARKSLHGWMTFGRFRRFLLKHYRKINHHLLLLKSNERERWIENSFDLDLATQFIDHNSNLTVNNFSAIVNGKLIYGA